MKNKKLLLALLAMALLALLSAIIIYRVTMSAIERRLAERNQVGFIVSTNAVVFRTPNSELLAPAWNEPVVLADPTTFKTIFHSIEFCLGADTKNVFWGEGRRVYRLVNCQAATFRLLTPDGRFTCDAQRVYFMGFELPNADPTTFQVLGAITSRDANQVYVGPLPLQGADPGSFSLVQEGQLPELLTSYSEGPCTDRKLRNDRLDVSGFRGHDKNKTFGGSIIRK